MIKISTNSRIIATALITLLGLTACSTMPGQPPASNSKDGPPLQSVNVSDISDAVPKYEPKSAFGNPATYTAVGKRYYVMDSAKGYNKTGVASWYGTKFHGKRTSSHEPYDMLAMTAASPTLPIPTYVRVTNLDNGRQVIVRVNDRGPFADGRIMDLSYAAAKKLGYAEKGTAHVQVTAITFDKNEAQPTTQLAQKSTKVYLQVGAFHQMAKAEEVKAQVAEWTHQNARIEAVNLNEKTWYRVQIGPLRNTEKSNVVDQLQQRGYHNTIDVVS